MTRQPSTSKVRSPLTTNGSWAASAAASCSVDVRSTVRPAPCVTPGPEVSGPEATTCPAASSPSIHSRWASRTASTSAAVTPSRGVHRTTQSCAPSIAERSTGIGHLPRHLHQNCMHFGSTASRPLAKMCMQLGGSCEYNAHMARSAARIPGIERVDLPEARQAIPRLHAYLRECILDGRIPPGTKLSQVALAEQLGVSRTPLREVLRMLQEEGYLEFEPNQRMRVADLDPVELDGDYACRILLETLALSMTLESIGSRQRREARRLLTAMRRAAQIGDLPGWFEAHHAYHRVMTAGAGEPLLRQLQSLEDRSVRYIRIYQQSEPAGWQTAGDAEHAAILDALAAGRPARRRSRRGRRPCRAARGVGPWGTLERKVTPAADGKKRSTKCHVAGRLCDGHRRRQGCYGQGLGDGPQPLGQGLNLAAKLGGGACGLGHGVASSVGASCWSPAR